MLINRYRNPSKIKSIQRGVFSANNSNVVNVTVASVDMSKTVINFAGCHLSVVGVSNHDNAVSIVLTSSTNLKFEKAGTANYARVSWELVEYV